MILKRGQVWIETVIYTLIGLSLIGIVLAILTPQIKDSRDRAVIDSTIESLNLLDSKVNEVLQAPGNKRKIEFEIKKGDLYIDSINDKVTFIFEDSKSQYSEPGESVYVGRIKLTTIKLTKDYQVILEVEYNYDFTWNGENSADSKKFSTASVPYNIFIENKGFVNSVPQVDFSEGN